MTLLSVTSYDTRAGGGDGGFMNLVNTGTTTLGSTTSFYNKTSASANGGLFAIGGG